jgi:hypothetical protein
MAYGVLPDALPGAYQCPTLDGYDASGREAQDNGRGGSGQGVTLEQHDDQ